MTFTRSTDYEAIKALLTEPRAWRRMCGAMGTPETFEVGPKDGLEYILATEHGKPVAVFVVLQGVEVHFCFAPGVWGRTLEIAQAFLEWLWSHAETAMLIGPIPKRNRLALSLALRAGFKKSDYTDREDMVYTYMKRPEVAVA